MTNIDKSRGIVLADKARHQIKTARQAKGISVESLAITTVLAEGTIKNIERPGKHGAREKHLLKVCKALGLDLRQLMMEVDEPDWTGRDAYPPEGKGAETSPPEVATVVQTGLVNGPYAVGGPNAKDSHNPTDRNVYRTDRFGNLSYRGIAVAIVGLLLLSAFAYKLSSRNGRTNPDALPAALLSLDPINPDWTAWAEKWITGGNGIIINRFDLDQGVATNGSINGEVEFSWHFPGLRPPLCLNIFSEWEPRGEVLLFNGPLTGDGHQTITFQLKAPPSDGLYRVRLFQCTSHSPATSFDGDGGRGEVSYLEKKLLVVPGYAAALIGQ